MINRLLQPEREEITEEWSISLNKKLLNLYSTLNIIRGNKFKMRWAGDVVRMGNETCIENFITKCNKNGKFGGRSKYVLEDNIETDLD
jgi:hypothetical protein